MSWVRVGAGALLLVLTWSVMTTRFTLLQSDQRLLHGLTLAAALTALLLTASRAPVKRLQFTLALQLSAMTLGVWLSLDLTLATGPPLRASRGRSSSGSGDRLVLGRGVGSCARLEQPRAARLV